MSGPETQRQRRGHDFYPPASLLATIPPLSGQDDIRFNDPVIHLHYSAVCGCDWWLAELDPDTWEAWGYVCVPIPMLSGWGFVSLAELERLKVGELGVVERDLCWTPRTVKEVDLPGLAY